METGPRLGGQVGNQETPDTDGVSGLQGKKEVRTPPLNRRGPSRTEGTGRKVRKVEGFYGSGEKRFRTGSKFEVRPWAEDILRKGVLRSRTLSEGKDLGLPDLNVRNETQRFPKRSLYVGPFVQPLRLMTQGGNLYDRTIPI